MRRILIVDDNPPWREAVRRNLEFMDYAVLEADNSTQALLELRRNQPSVVITDLSMNTRTEGLDLITAIKEQYPHIPVILISAVGTFEEGAQARQLGAIAVLGKTRIDREMETLYSTLDEVFALQETVTRLRSLARRYLTGETDTFPPRDLEALSHTAGMPNLDPWMRRELFDLLADVRTRLQLGGREQQFPPVPGASDQACPPALIAALPRLTELDRETITMLTTAERLLADQPDSTESAVARNICFSLTFAVENEIKHRLDTHLQRFLTSDEPRTSLLEAMYDRQLGQLDLTFSRHVLHFLRPYQGQTEITHELVRRTLETLLRHGPRYKPDGLKALGVIVFLFGRTWTWESARGMQPVDNPLRLEGLAPEQRWQLASGLVHVQHLRNPFIHPEFEEQANIHQLRQAVLDVLALALEIR